MVNTILLGLGMLSFYNGPGCGFRTSYLTKLVSILLVGSGMLSGLLAPFVLFGISFGLLAPLTPSCPWKWAYLFEGSSVFNVWTYH